MPKVSVIVPVYNTENYLDKCLTTLTNQTLKDIELILVNDGSTDGSESIIKKFMKNDNRIKLFNKTNGGQASARNLGLTKAKGDYIIFVDSDDYFEKNLVEAMYNVATGYDIVVSDYYRTCKTDQYVKILNGPSHKLSNIDYFKSDTGPWNKIFKRVFLIENNFSFPEGIMYEDYASIPVLIKYNPTIFYCSNAFVHYVQSEKSTMRSEKYKSKYEDIFKASKYLFDNLHGFGYDCELEYLLCFHMLYLGSLNFYKFKKYEQINKISDFMKEKFPLWKRNKYVKKMTLKERILMKLFYEKKYKIISFIQKMKRW